MNRFKKHIKNWETIYSQPSEEYKYYDLHEAHEELPRVIEIFKKRKVSKVLDLGCGVGRNLLPLVRKGFETTGIDGSKEAIKKIKQKLKDKSLLAKIKWGVFQNLSLPDNYFDAVISIQTLNHGYESDIKVGFDEMSRVLKIGGIIFLTLPGRVANGKVRYVLIKTAKKVEEHTYLPTIGKEIGSPHFIFNKLLIKKYLKNYRLIKNIWKDDKGYYCVLAEKIG